MTLEPVKLISSFEAWGEPSFLCPLRKGQINLIPPVCNLQTPSSENGAGVSGDSRGQEERSRHTGVSHVPLSVGDARRHSIRLSPMCLYVCVLLYGFEGTQLRGFLCFKSTLFRDTTIPPELAGQLQGNQCSS